MLMFNTVYEVAALRLKFTPDMGEAKLANRLPKTEKIKARREFPALLNKKFQVGYLTCGCTYPLDYMQSVDAVIKCGCLTAIRQLPAPSSASRQTLIKLSSRLAHNRCFLLGGCYATALDIDQLARVCFKRRTWMALLSLVGGEALPLESLVRNTQLPPSSFHRIIE